MSKDDPIIQDSMTLFKPSLSHQPPYPGLQRDGGWGGGGQTPPPFFSRPNLIHLLYKVLSLYSTRTQNTWRRGLALGNAPDARILHWGYQHVSI